MTIVYRNPTGDDAESGDWAGAAAGTRYTLVDDHPDTTNADSLTHGNSAGYITFTFSAFTVPTGAVIDQVRLIYYDFKNGSSAAQMAGRLKVGGNVYAASNHNPGNGIANITLRTDQWTQNPKTSAAWTVDDVNGSGANALQAFGCISGDANPNIVLTSIRCEVVYTVTVAAAEPEQLELRDVQVAARSAEAVVAEKLEVRDAQADVTPTRVQLSFAEVTMPAEAAAEPIAAERLEQLEIRDLPSVLTIQGVARAEQLEVSDLPTVTTVQGVAQAEQVEARDLQSAARSVEAAGPEQLELRDLTDAGWRVQATEAERLEVRDEAGTRAVLGAPIAEKLEARDVTDATNPVRFVAIEERLEVRELLDASTAGEPIAAEQPEKLEIRDLAVGRLTLSGVRAEQLEVRDVTAATGLHAVAVAERLEVRDLASAPTYVQLSFAEVTMPEGAEELVPERLEVRDQPSATSVLAVDVEERLELFDAAEALLPTNVIVTWAQVTSPEAWNLVQEEKLEIRDLPIAGRVAGAVQEEKLEVNASLGTQLAREATIAEQLEIRVQVDADSSGQVSGIMEERLELRDLPVADLQRQAEAAERLEVREAVSCVVLRVGSIAEQTAVRDDVATAQNIWALFVEEKLELRDSGEAERPLPPPPYPVGGIGGSGGGARGDREVFDKSGFFQRLERLLRQGVPLREAIKRADQIEDEPEVEEPEDRPVMLSDFNKAIAGLSRDIEDLARLIVEDRD